MQNIARSCLYTSNSQLTTAKTAYSTTTSCSTAASVLSFSRKQSIQRRKKQSLLLCQFMTIFSSASSSSAGVALASKHFSGVASSADKPFLSFTFSNLFGRKISSTSTLSPPAPPSPSIVNSSSSSSSFTNNSSLESNSSSFENPLKMPTSFSYKQSDSNLLSQTKDTNVNTTQAHQEIQISLTTSISTSSNSLSSSGNESSDRASSPTSSVHESTDLQGTNNNRLNFDIVIGSSYLPKTYIMNGLFDPSDAPITNVDDEIRPDCGEDAFFTLSSPHFTCLGVADGVGGWNALGINPALFAWELMENCQNISSTKSFPLPWEILEEAYDRVKSEGKVSAGSSTACLITLDKKCGIIHSANLGDSAYIVLRFKLDKVLEEDVEDFAGSRKDNASFLSSGDDESSKSDSSSNSSNSSHRLTCEIVHQTKILQHYFNAPYQLAILPKGLSNLQRLNYMNDHPRVAHKETQGPLENGDIIIMATDGLFDNLFVEEIVAIVREEMEDIFHELLSTDNVVHDNEHGLRAILQEKVQKSADEIVQRAAYRSISDLMTPFAREARIKGWDEYSGGKMDDVTVLTGVILAQPYRQPMALL